MSSRNARRHTKPCVYYQKNQCPLSADACDYAHILVAQDELDTLKLPQATLRTKPCRFYLGGQCKDGFWCRFKHPANAPIHRASSESDVAQVADDLSASEGEYSDDVDVRDLDPDKKAKPEEHPRYRTRPCRNFILGKCAYGDHCSYQHILPSSTSPSTSGYASPSPPHSHAVPTSGMPSSNVFPPSFPSNASVPHPGLLPISRMSSSSSQAHDEAVAPITDAFSVMALPTGMPAYPPMYSTVPHSAPGVRHSHSSPPPTTPPYSMYPHSHSHHSHSMPPMTMGIVHLPVAVPMYQQQPHRQHRDDEYRDATHSSRTRPSSSSHPSGAAAAVTVEKAKTSPSRNVLIKTKLCKFYSETGTCHKGDNCNFIHDKTRVSATSSPVREHMERRRSSTASGSSSEGVTESKKGHAGDEDKTGGFHKIPWRVVGGGVMMARGGDSGRQYQEEATPRVDAPGSHLPQTHQVHPLSGNFIPSKSPSPLTLDSQSVQASPTGSTGSSSTQQGSRRSSKPTGLKISPPPAHITSPTSGGSKYQSSVDWSDDYDDEIIVPTNESGFPSSMSKASKSSQKVPTWQTRSSPSSPLRSHSGASSLFPAESP